MRTFQNKTSNVQSILLYVQIDFKFISFICHILCLLAKKIIKNYHFISTSIQDFIFTFVTKIEISDKMELLYSEYWIANILILLTEIHSDSSEQEHFN